MRIVSRKTLKEAWTKHRDAEGPLRAWCKEAEAADWSAAGSNPEDVRARYRTASVVGDDRVVCNIKGNTYRLVVAVSYPARIVFIKFFGTHAEYDRIDVSEVRHDD